MNAKFIALGLSLASLYCHSASAGVVVGGTRVVYDGTKKESSIQINNPDKTAWLIQSWVENSQGVADKSAFFVTPPLFRLDGNQNNTLRIMLATPALAKNKESLYWLNIKSIPAVEQNTAGNSLQLAVKTRIKLIYRPAELKGQVPEQLADKLTWQRIGNRLTVTNPTPYYMNFYAISVGGKAVQDVTWVAPGATATFALSPAHSGSQVSWQIISDYGASGATHQAAL
ncbi:MAG: fimbria/pilus periplasmic chaperone [Scandinavium sp.]|uniref:fimbria/pilus periplasmic chaperone n=1 Tax=Scandinavium sp. TaxID=2830653 RepID=UPI003F3AE54A